MPQDAITLTKTAFELNALLKGAKVNKVTQPAQDEVILTLYTKFGNAKLCICTNAVGTRVGITELEKKNPLTPPGFCMLLRKHLLNSSVKSIAAISGERIIKITFDGKNEFLEDCEKHLYCEIMGKYSNAIFCENEVILGTMKSTQLDLGKERVLLSGALYTLPKSQGKVDVYQKQNSLNCLNKFSGGNFAEYIFNNFTGFSIATATEIVFRFFGKFILESSIVKTLEFYDFMLDFINSSNLKPCVVNCNGKLCDFYFCDYLTVSGEKIFFDNLTDAETYFFDNKSSLKQFSELKNRLLSAVNSKHKKEIKKLQIIAEKELSCQNAEDERRKGELITANIYKIKRGDKWVEVIDYYNENKPVKIPLDDKLSPNENAQKYFKKYTKLKNTLKAIIPQKEQIISESEYLKSVIAEINSAQNTADLLEIEEELKQSGIIKGEEKKQNSKKQNAKINIRIFEYSGYKIIAGKNNLQNDKLTSLARPSDTWLHTKDYHSAHVIIESMGKHVPDEILQLAAEICAFYSEAQHGDKVPVDYTLKKYVKKPPKSKFGSVIYTDFKTVFVTPNAHKNLEK